MYLELIIATAIPLPANNIQNALANLTFNGFVVDKALDYIPAGTIRICFSITKPSMKFDPLKTTNSPN